MSDAQQGDRGSDDRKPKTKKKKQQQQQQQKQHKKKPQPPQHEETSDDDPSARRRADILANERIKPQTKKRLLAILDDDSYATEREREDAMTEAIVVAKLEQHLLL
jgi:hypothetical protein